MSRLDHPALQIQELGFRYSPNADSVLQIDQLTVAEGEFISLLGASGSGKSTLLRIIAGLLQPTGGRVTNAVRTHGEVGFVFQNANLIPWRTARQNLQLPAELGQTGTPVSEATVQELLQLAGLEPADANKRPGELSGGMQMRLALARALSQSPSLLMMDEPFGAVDDVLRMQLEERVRQIHRDRGLTTILVTHNIGEAVFMSDRILVLGGRPATIRHNLSLELGSERNQTTRTSTAYYDYVTQVTTAFQAAAIGSADGIERS